ncbi:MAG TPA: hypothetical protein VKM54_03760 [Myxococcota bacterium]|nr:hypothetical protein [Myxococcota bacterium]
MADSAVFDFVAEELERTTNLDRMEARGMLRLVLKQALFDSKTLKVKQMQMVIDRLLAAHLCRCGVENPESVCEGLAMNLKAKGFGSGVAESPDEIFGRLLQRPEATPLGGESPPSK